MTVKYFGMITTAASADYTACALRSFYECTALETADRFFLIDNDADYPHSSLDCFKPRPTLLVNKQPLGFAANVNQIVKIALLDRADLFFLNNDLAFAPGWLEPLLLEQPVILSPLSNNQQQYQSTIMTINPYMLLADYQGKEIEFRQLALLHAASESGYQKVLTAPFFCVKIPYQILKEVGEFDQQFGQGGAEDYDYCLRTWLAGFSVAFARASYVLHFGGRSSWANQEAFKERERFSQELHNKFLGKWGQDLLRVCFFEESQFLKDDPDLNLLIEKSDFTALIKALRS